MLHTHIGGRSKQHGGRSRCRFAQENGPSKRLVMYIRSFVGLPAQLPTQFATQYLHSICLTGMVEWSTWGSKLESIFAPIFATLPNLVVSYGHFIVILSFFYAKQCALWRLLGFRALKLPQPATPPSQFFFPLASARLISASGGIPCRTRWLKDLHTES